MSTYDHQRVLTDWSNGTLTPDMAIGHSLQHIDGLYARQKRLQDKVNHLENTVKSLQVQIDRWVKSLAELEQKKTPTQPSHLCGEKNDSAKS